MVWSKATGYEVKQLDEIGRIEVIYTGNNNPQLQKNSDEHHFGLITRAVFGGRMEVLLIDGKVHNVRITDLELYNFTKGDGITS